MKKWFIILIVVLILLVAGFYALNTYIYNEKQGDTPQNTTMTNTPETKKKAPIIPISHAAMVLNLGEQTIYTDPVGGVEAFKGQSEPTIIVVTDIHGDHFDVETLTALAKENTVTIVPPAVAEMLPNNFPGTVFILRNGDKTTQKGVDIEAIPMYNIPESADSKHTKGRGNGYVITSNGQRIYIAGDTSATPEMKALKNIDIAFIPMNGPTMSVEEAAAGVLAFQPKVVHPYHYRNQDGFSDINKFKELVEAGNKNITVDLLNFYPESK